ncbi:TetR/AcrR family transcriptional regulator [uncultured Croceitalea sp.]|uniref:TetR/AcrR family transcriptional regulator n=1 Tax=uncultured Croceitalea sp. TaxID=1798908 RepID=UPI003305F04B
MPRKKEYKEEDVIDKAMHLFWLNGYENTSMQMLEKEMGINKFSIYSSFGNKSGVFVESLKLYRKKLNKIISQLEASTDGVLGIKQYFYNTLDFSKGKDFCKGCLVTNTANEVDNNTDPKILSQIEDFSVYIRQLFLDNLSQDASKGKETIEEQADYLLIAMIALSSASKICNQAQLNNYIENTFNRL